MPPRRRNQSLSDWLTENAIALFMLIGAAAVAYANIATKPYVDEGLANNRKYVDDKMAATLDKAIAHADLNQKENQVRMEAISSAVKTQGAKIDIVIDTLRENSKRRN